MHACVFTFQSVLCDEEACKATAILPDSSRTLRDKLRRIDPAIGYVYSTLQYHIMLLTITLLKRGCFIETANFRPIVAIGHER